MRLYKDYVMRLADVLQKTLARLIPHIISVSFAADGSDNHVKAVMQVTAPGPLRPRGPRWACSGLHHAPHRRGTYVTAYHMPERHSKYSSSPTA